MINQGLSAFHFTSFKTGEKMSFLGNYC